MNPVDRFMAKVEKLESGCWQWTAATTYGYGIFSMPTGKRGARNVRAHRWAYEQFVGPIPDGMHLDHLCSNPICVNPDHLEPVTPNENLKRSDERLGIRSAQTSCRRQHDPMEFVFGQDGKRYCRACKREEWHRRQEVRQPITTVTSTEEERFLCCCGEPDASGVVHRAFSPCYMDEPITTLTSTEEEDRG